MRGRAPLLALSVTLALAGCSQRLPPQAAGPSETAPAETGTLVPAPPSAEGVRWLEPAAHASLVVALPSGAAGGEDLYLIDPQGTAPRLLAHFEEEIVSAAPTADGRALAVKTTRFPGVRHDRLLVLSLEDMSLQVVAEQTALYTYAWLPLAGGALIYAEIPEGGVERLQLFRPATGETRLVTDFAPPGLWDIAGPALGGEAALIAHFHGGGLLYDAVALLDPESGQRTTLYADEDMLTSVVAPDPRGEVALLVTLKALGSLEQSSALLDLTIASLRPLTALDRPETSIDSLPVWSPDGEHFAYTAAPADGKGGGPMQLVIFELAGETVSIIREIPSPTMLIRALAWASDDVLITNNLHGEPLERVLYSIHSDGSGEQRILPGRFLAVVP